MNEQIAAATPRFYRIAELRLILGLGRSQTNEVVSQPGFPGAVRLVPNGDRRWRVEEVEAWLADLVPVEPAEPARRATRTEPAVNGGDVVFMPARPGRRRRAA